MHNDFSKYPTDKPKISLSPGPTYFEKGKNITLPKCHVTSFPPAIITWSRVRGELAYSRTVMKDGQLSIISAQKRDSGFYECKASNDLGEDSALTLLSVLELPRFTSNPPAQLNVRQKQNISISCQAAGELEQCDGCHEAIASRGEAMSHPTPQRIDNPGAESDDRAPKLPAVEPRSGGLRSTNSWPQKASA